ncbi:MAG: hypothetical protein ACR2LJ_06155 [Acidimicrobiales bacterium]
MTGPDALWTIPGEWSPTKGATPVEAPTTVMVSAVVVVATAILAIDPNPATFANSPARKPVPNISWSLHVDRFGLHDRQARAVLVVTAVG